MNATQYSREFVCGLFSTAFPDAVVTAGNTKIAVETFGEWHIRYYPETDGVALDGWNVIPCVIRELDQDHYEGRWRPFFDEIQRVKESVGKVGELRVGNVSRSLVAIDATEPNNTCLQWEFNVYTRRMA